MNKRSHSRNSRQAALIFGLGLFFCCFFSFNCTYASDDTTQESKIAEEQNDDVRFYAFLDNDYVAPKGPLYKFAKNNEFAKTALFLAQPDNTKFRPLLLWRRWAEKKQEAWSAFSFCLLISWTLWILAPKRLAAAESVCRNEFWKSFFTGIIVSSICCLLARAAFLSLIGWSLGILLTATLELGLLAGLSLIVSMIGHSSALLLRLNKYPFFAKRINICRFLEFVLGALICATLLQIPLIADLPRIGTRIVALFCVLGLGALFRSIKQEKA